MKNIFKILSTILILVFLTFKAYAGMSNIVPTTALNKIISATNFSSSNNNNQTEASMNNSTSSILNAAELKKNITADAKTFGLKVDEAALAVLSDANMDTASISKTLAKLSENVSTDMYDWDYIPEKTPDTYIYQLGDENTWVELSKVTEYDGRDYSEENNAFDNTATQLVRSDVYVDFVEKQIYADIWTKVTMKGESQVSAYKKTGVAGITSMPVVAIDTHAICTQGESGCKGYANGSDNINGPDFDDNPSSIQDVAISGGLGDVLQLHNNPYNGDTGTKNWYNHHDDDSDAEKRVFLYGKFTTSTAAAAGTGTIALEAAYCDSCDNATYIPTIERWEVSATLEGKKAK